MAMSLLKNFEQQILGERGSLVIPDAFTWFDAVFDIPLAWFHREILDAVVYSDDRFILVLAPPGHRKTTICMAGVAYLLATNKNFHNCVIASYESGYSSKIMMQICDLLQTPTSERMLGRVIPPAPEYDPRIKKWTSEERYFLNTPAFSKDPTIKVIGQKSGGVGTRSSIVLADDLVTVTNSATPTLRANLWDWFAGGPLKRLEPNGKVVVIGARIFDGDLYGHLKGMSKENGGEWRVLEYAASPDKPLWPERFGSSELLSAYHNDPVMFPAQYLQNPLSSTRGILRKEWLQYYIPGTIPNIDDMAHFAGVDPSKKGDSKSDKFTMAIGAYDGTNVYLKEIVSGTYTIDQQLEVVKSMAKKYRLSLVNVEEDYALAELMRKDNDIMFRMNFSPSLVSKELRIRNLGSLALKGKFMLPGKVNEEGLFSPREDFQDFYQEWIDFPAGANDDNVDSVEKLMEAVSMGVEAASFISHPKDMNANRRSRLLFHDEVMI